MHLHLKEEIKYAWFVLIQTHRLVPDCPPAIGVWLFKNNFSHSLILFYFFSGLSDGVSRAFQWRLLYLVEVISRFHDFFSESSDLVPVNCWASLVFLAFGGLLKLTLGLGLVPASSVCLNSDHILSFLSYFQWLLKLLKGICYLGA